MIEGKMQAQGRQYFRRRWLVLVLSLLCLPAACQDEAPMSACLRACRETQEARKRCLDACSREPHHCGKEMYLACRSCNGFEGACQRCCERIVPCAKRVGNSDLLRACGEMWDGWVEYRYCPTDG